MSNLIIIARVVAKEDSVQSVKSELLKLVAVAREEDGCIKYSMHQDNDNPAAFMFYETWASQASLEMHMNTDSFKAYLKATEGLVAEKRVYKLSSLE